MGRLSNDKRKLSASSLIQQTVKIMADTNKLNRYMDMLIGRARCCGSITFNKSIDKPSLIAIKQIVVSYPTLLKALEKKKT